MNTPLFLGCFFEWPIQNKKVSFHHVSSHFGQVFGQGVSFVARLQERAKERVQQLEGYSAEQQAGVAGISSRWFTERFHN